MFSSRTPAACREARVPERREEMILVFQRAWMMPMRSGEPVVGREGGWSGLFGAR